MAATRWAEILLYDYGRHVQYIPLKDAQNFQKVSFEKEKAKRNENKM